jgi:hypothetical protein
MTLVSKTLLVLQEIKEFIQMEEEGSSLKLDFWIILEISIPMDTLFNPNQSLQTLMEVQEDIFTSISLLP